MSRSRTSSRRTRPRRRSVSARETQRERERDDDVERRRPPPLGLALVARARARGVDSQLPAALVSAISSNMTRLLQLFAVWDTDGDGTISPKEFERALLQLSIQTQPADASKLFV